MLIPFTLSFVDEPQADFERKKDGQLKEKLWAENSGILAWLVRGCSIWQREGLNPPDIVKAATEEYKTEEDIMSRFIEECCDRQPEGTINASVLYQAYKNWCEENSFEVPSQTSFGRKMGGIFPKSNSSGRRIYSGLLLKQE